MQRMAPCGVMVSACGDTISQLGSASSATAASSQEAENAPMLYQHCSAIAETSVLPALLSAQV